MMLQRQAARRVQQMQEHSRQVFEAHRQDAPTLYRRPAPLAEPPPAPTAPFSLDGEQWLLLGLALLLFRSGCRTELLLALLYLAL